jgi:hypothetical protein
MSGLLDARIQVEAPVGWHRIPVDGIEAWATALVGAAGGEAVGALIAVAAAARAQPPSLPFVFLGNGPVALAWAFLRLVPRSDPDAAAAASTAVELLGGPSRGDVEVWHREIARVDVGGAPGVLLTDLLTVPRAPHDREVQRRAIVTWFPPEQLCLHLTLSTPAASVGDVAVEALAFAGGVRLEHGSAA